LVIVPIAWASASVAFETVDRFTKNVSFPSRVLSPRMVTEIVRLVWPAANVSEPEAAT
jgi:hypothetical protein